MDPRQVIIIGGGLAGMTVAKELANYGLRVLILESAPRLGGKASATLRNGQWEDHGYHLFPGWYANTRALLSQIGCTDNLIDLDEFYTLRKGEWPRFGTTKELSSIDNMLHNLFRGVLPFRENLISFYFLMDLAAEPFAERHFLDRVSALGFMRSRFYANDELARHHHETVLQAVSVPYYDCSAMTLRKLCRMWAQRPKPLFSILNGNLYEKFIGPYRRYLETLGVEIRCDTEVERIAMANRRISEIVMRDGSRVALGPADAAVLAVPHATVLQVVDPEIIEAELEERVATDDEHLGLADLANLRSVPMAAWHLHLKRRIPNVPKGHVIFIGSRFKLSFIDVSRHWNMKHTVLNLIASNFEPLRQLSEPEMKEFLLQDLLEYVPIRPQDLPDDHGFLQPHLDEPLFVNTVAAWHYRPATTTGIDNLFISGDYCRTQADLTTMESAVMSGVNTAGKILSWAGVAEGVEAIKLPEPSEILLQTVKYAALPTVAAFAAWRQIEESLRSWLRPEE